jgi:hypothetical protein
VIFESHLAVRVVLEYLLLREGYSVDSRGEAPFAVAGPAHVLVGDEAGLYVFVSGNVVGTIKGLDPELSYSPGTFAEVIGIRVFVPKPFGAGDVLRVVRAVRGFDGRRRPRSRKQARLENTTEGEDGWRA